MILWEVDLFFLTMFLNSIHIFYISFMKMPSKFSKIIMQIQRLFH